MHSRKNIFILTLLLVCSIISQAQVQTDTTQNKTKFFDKIGHWVTAYMLGGPDFMQTQRNDFKSSAFAELYIEGSIVKDVWMFNMLNRITEMRHEQKQTPHILIKILLKPENEALSLYSVNLNVTASQNLPINLNTIASQAVSKHLNKTPYSEPAYAVDDIEKALEEIFQNLKTALGNSLAPNLLLRYNNEIYWSGHEITVLANEGNSVEIEALDKNLQPIPSTQLTWTNASPFMHKGLVDLTNLSSQQVSVRRQQQGSQPDNATVTLKRVNVTEDINDLLKALIIEVLSAKKEEVQDTLNTLLQNRTENAEKIKQYIANLERYNFPMEGPASGSLMFPTPLYRADSAALMNTDNEQTRNIATSILALKKQKAIKRKIKIKANVAAFADLVVDNPERLEDLLDELLRNSGSLIAQLILNRDNSGTRQTARNIVVDFINRNIERIAGSAAMATPAETEPIIEIPVLPSAAPAFDPARRLYLSASLPANTRQELESALSDYLNNLEEPLYVFVNYSHDANTENYLSRAIGNKPVGIPEGARYKVYTIINIPGSIMENVVGEAGEVTATTTKGVIVEGVMRVQVEIPDGYIPQCGMNGKPKQVEKIIFYSQTCSSVNEGAVTILIREGNGAYLCARERFAVIKCLANGSILDHEEAAIIKLITDTPNEHASELLGYFRQDNTGLINKINTNFGFGNYSSVFKAIQQLYLKGTTLATINIEVNRINSTFLSDKTREEKAQENYFTWFEGGVLKAMFDDGFVFNRFDNVQIANDGTISFQYATDPRQTGTTTTPISLKPFDLVGIRARGNTNEVLEAGNGDIVYVPAVILPLLISKKETAELIEGLNALAVATGVTALFTGATRFAIISGGIDVLLGGSALVVDSYKDDILKMQHGETFLDAYVFVNNAFLVYFTGRTILQLTQALPKLGSTFTTFKNSDDFAKLKTTNPSKASAIESEVNNIIRETENVLTKEQVFEEIALYRKQNALPDYYQNDFSTGTVARCEINGKKFYGANSGAATVYTLSLEQRRKWFNLLVSKGKLVDPNTGNQLTNLGQAQFLSHAEAEALIKAKNASVSFPKVVDLYVDRVTCANSCRIYLPDLMTELGIDQLNIYWVNQSNSPLTLIKK